MKKVVVLLIGMLFVVSVTKAQTIDFGVKGGLLYSAMEVKDVDGFDAAKEKSKAGYLFGVFARVGGKKLFFQPELQYRVRTGDFDFGNVASSVIKDNAIEVKYKTLDIPLQVGVNVLKLPLVKIAAHAGPVASFKLGDDTTLKNEIANFKLDKYSDYKSFVWSGQIGVTADVMNFSLDISYEKGFSDISKHIGANDLVLVTLGFKLF